MFYMLILILLHYRNDDSVIFVNSYYIFSMSQVLTAPIINFVYSPSRGSSKEYPQCMFKNRKKKNYVYQKVTL